MRDLHRQGGEGCIVYGQLSICDSILQAITKNCRLFSKFLSYTREGSQAAKVELASTGASTSTRSTSIEASAPFPFVSYVDALTTTKSKERRRQRSLSEHRSNLVFA